jgi:hypothetical protein
MDWVDELAEDLDFEAMAAEMTPEKKKETIAKCKKLLLDIDIGVTTPTPFQKKIAEMIAILLGMIDNPEALDEFMEEDEDAGEEWKNG